MPTVHMLQSWIPEGHKLWQCDKPACELRILTLNGESTSHKCPYQGGSIHVSYSAYGPTLLQQTWDEIDSLYEEYNQLKAPSSDVLTPEQRVILTRMEGRMRGIASVLARFMVPHLTTENEIVREVAKRYTAKKLGEPYETPGLGSRSYEPPPGDNKITPAVKITLSKSQQELVRAAAESISNEQLATMLKVSTEQIAVVRG